ncbi:response regulator [Antarcticibacterium flavum]|uniref:histidine kinase n=1 Tax=Antarcticibacterium flavum TaxID=2058175 RepID=A0A5B7X5N6_9FLAO|nr:MULTISPECIES: ATP-binding protein [Antarcticibacterium]MCM4160017.1 hybrid sensor histidine kinase/response regulator [Antarcticibacterium sp. W02-3]QCY70395.1 response regulator [Antarcticibacterium flavum]
MKKLFFSLILLFTFYIGAAFQEKSQEEIAEINKEIQQLLNEAEISVNVLEFEKALAQLNQSLDLAKQINDQKFIALSSSILAQLFYIRHDLDRAATELQRAISIQREINDDAGLAYSYLTNAKIFDALGEFDRAHKYLSLARDYYLKENNTEYLGIVDLNSAITILHAGNTPKGNQEALSYIHRAEKNLQDANNDYELSRLYFFKARALMWQGNLEQGKAEAEKALKIAEANNFGSMIMSSTRLLSQVYELAGNYQESLEYLQSSNSIRDSIFNINREALALDANTRYGVDAMRTNLRELTRQNAEQEKSLKVNKLTTILSVALITILSLLTLSLYKNNNLRARANDLLQKKNDELTIAKENAEKASLAKAQFLSTITHELRTPLYAVTGLTHLLLEESPTENQKEHLNSLKFSGEYLLSLINNILDLNKLEARKVEILETSFNLEKRISDVLIALKNSADDKNTKLHFNFDQEIPKKLKGDPLKISQILINLIGNSIKFTENGDIWINVSQVNQVGQQVFLHFEIKDNGEGITKEKQSAIFENFTQGSLQINRKFGGTGLGLSIVKNLLNLMNSEIHLDSELGKGSTFSFDLKFEAFEQPGEKTAISSQKEAAPNNNGLQGKKILIVEDNKINQMITRKILEKHKVICDVADNGTIAIEKVKNNPFDLILMDIHMPGISGIEATIEIRKFDDQIPIVALTAVTLDENLDEFYLNGFTDIIPKPYKTEEFFHKINKHIAATIPA